MKPWRTRSRRTLVQDRWISLHADECELSNGRLISPYYVMEEKEWVHIVAMNSSGEVLLTRQYRHAAKLVCCELPCGVAEAGEDPLEAAKRELKEETGHTADEWAKVSALFANPARQTNRVHCFLARGLKKVGTQSLDDSEEISFEFVSPAEVTRRIQQGDFCQALHVASYLLAVGSLNQTGGAST